MLTGPGTIHWSGGCEVREFLDIALTPHPEGAEAHVVWRNAYPPRGPVRALLTRQRLHGFVHELRRLRAAPDEEGDFSTSDDTVAVDLPLADGPLKFKQDLADTAPPLDPIIAAIHRLADAIAAG